MLNNKTAFSAEQLTRAVSLLRGSSRWQSFLRMAESSPENGLRDFIRVQSYDAVSIHRSAPNLQSGMADFLRTQGFLAAQCGRGNDLSVGVVSSVAMGGPS